MMRDLSGHRFGDYRVTRFIGKGGFGNVYLGQHVTNGTLVAIKLMETDLDLKRFIQETSTIFRMKHPHIVQMLDFGISSDGIPFLVMAYAPNGTLRHRHPQGTRLPLATVISYVTPIADALQFVHDQKRVHCDVKPENILLGPNNELWLSDFGISIISRTSSLRSLASITGTALYMAPEQFRGRPEPASDQYALAVMVYEWLSGTPPFTQGDFVQLGFQHATEPVPSLCEQVPTILLQIEQVVMKALAKEPRERFDRVEDFATALQKASVANQSTRATASPHIQPVQSPIPSTVHVWSNKRDKNLAVTRRRISLWAVITTRLVPIVWSIFYNILHVIVLIAKPIFYNILHVIVLIAWPIFCIVLDVIAFMVCWHLGEAGMITAITGLPTPIHSMPCPPGFNQLELGIAIIFGFLAFIGLCILPIGVIASEFLVYQSLEDYGYGEGILRLLTWVGILLLIGGVSIVVLHICAPLIVASNSCHFFTGNAGHYETQIPRSFGVSPLSNFMFQLWGKTVQVR